MPARSSPSTRTRRAMCSSSSAALSSVPGAACPCAMRACTPSTSSTHTGAGWRPRGTGRGRLVRLSLLVAPLERFCRLPTRLTGPFSASWRRTPTTRVRSLWTVPASLSSPLVSAALPASPTLAATLGSGALRRADASSPTSRTSATSSTRKTPGSIRRGAGVLTPRGCLGLSCPSTPLLPFL